MKRRTALSLSSGTAFACTAAILAGGAPARAATGTTPVTVLSESFSTGHVPAGWVVVDKDDGNPGPQPDNQGFWRFDDPDHDGNQTGGAGGFAGLDARTALGPAHASLNAPYLKKGMGTVATLTFRTARVSAKAADYSRVQYSLDKGHIWSTVWSVSGTTAIAPGTLVTIVLPSDVTASKHVSLRWDDRGYKVSYWQIDDITLTAS